MVKVTIFIEGDIPGLNSEALTIGANSSFREAFHMLFKEIIDSSNIDLVIESYGTITQTRPVLDNTRIDPDKSMFLIDLDAPKKEKENRLNYYDKEDWLRIFFMIQQMEAWILSQPDKIEKYGIKKRFQRKESEKSIQDDPLIKNKHSEEIKNPSEKLDTIIRRFFDESRKGKLKGKRYHKTKDAPDLIALLDPNILYHTFDEFQMLVDKIKSLES